MVYAWEHGDVEKEIGRGEHRKMKRQEGEEDEVGKKLKRGAVYGIENICKRVQSRGNPKRWEKKARDYRKRGGE